MVTDFETSLTETQCEEILMMLENLLSRLDGRDLSQSFVEEIGRVLIQRLGPPSRVRILLEHWNERCREVIGKEQRPLQN